jgi:hypothetical protein
MTEKSWVHYLCFDAYFEDALVKMRSATGLGTTYALFTALNEYFYEKGYIDEKGYLFHRERYSRPLVDEFEKHLEMQDNKTRSEIFRKEQELTELKNQLNNACRNWNRMKDTAKTWYVTKAKTHPELSISKKILMLANERR